MKFVKNFYEFSTLALPLALQVKDTEILACLVNDSKFVLKRSDLDSFVTASIALNWHEGLKIFLSSAIVKLTYLDFPHDQERSFISEKLLEGIASIKDSNIF